MALNKTTTAADIVTALGLTGADAVTAQTKWELIIDALYTRIKADIHIESSVSTTGTAVAQTGLAESTTVT